MQQRCEYEYSTEDRDGDMPGNDLPPQHIEEADDQCQCTDLTHRAGTIGMVAEEEVER